MQKISLKDVCVEIVPNKVHVEVILKGRGPFIYVWPLKIPKVVLESLDMFF